MSYILREARDAGIRAAIVRRPYDSNPHTELSDMARSHAWDYGYQMAYQAMYDIGIPTAVVAPKYIEDDYITIYHLTLESKYSTLDHVYTAAQFTRLMSYIRADIAGSDMVYTTKTYRLPKSVAQYLLA
jgi:hypothetical protein